MALMSRYKGGCTLVRKESESLGLQDVMIKQEDLSEENVKALIPKVSLMNYSKDLKKKISRKKSK